MSKTTRDFAITLDSEERTGKIQTRQRLLSLCLDSIDENSNILTLPSIYWKFEKMLFNHIKDKKINIHSFEYDYKLFCVASLKIPMSRYSHIKQKISDLNYCKISVKWCDNNLHLHHCNVFEYLKLTEIEFDFMWIDLVSPLDFIKDDIKYIHDRLSDKGTCILSFLKGRERIVIENRISFVADILTDMEIIESFEYKDTVTMINIVLKKKEIINYETLIAL